MKKLSVDRDGVFKLRTVIETAPQGGLNIIRRIHIWWHLKFGAWR